MSLPFLLRDVDIRCEPEQSWFDKRRVVCSDITCILPTKDRLLLSMFSTPKGEKYATIVRNLKMSLAFIPTATQANRDWGGNNEIQSNPPITQQNAPFLSLFTNLRKLEVLGRKFGGQISADVMDGLTRVLLNLQHLHTLVIEGGWLYDLPPKLVYFKCRTFDPGYQISLFTSAIERSSSLRDLDVQLYCRASSLKERPRSIDWTNFNPKEMCPNLKHIILSILGAPTMKFESRRLSVLLRLIAQCTSLETLMLDNLNIDFDDLSRICSELHYLQNLEISCPRRILESHLPSPANSWNSFQDYLMNSKNLVLLRFIHPYLAISRSKADCNYDESSQDSHENTLDMLSGWSEKWFNEQMRKLASPQALNIT